MLGKPQGKKKSQLQGVASLASGGRGRCQSSLSPVPGQRASGLKAAFWKSTCGKFDKFMTLGQGEKAESRPAASQRPPLQAQQ